jgi:hypothetical protein
MTEKGFDRLVDDRCLAALQFRRLHTHDRHSAPIRSAPALPECPFRLRSLQPVNAIAEELEVDNLF